MEEPRREPAPPADTRPASAEEKRGDLFFAFQLAPFLTEQTIFLQFRLSRVASESPAAAAAAAGM